MKKNWCFLFLFLFYSFFPSFNTFFVWILSSLSSLSIISPSSTFELLESESDLYLLLFLYYLTVFGCCFFCCCWCCYCYCCCCSCLIFLFSSINDLFSLSNIWYLIFVAFNILLNWDIWLSSFFLLLILNN